MAKPQSEKERARENVEIAINRVLNGQMHLVWLVEKIRTSGISKEDLRDVLDVFRKNYAENIIFRELEKTCKQNGFV